MGTVTATRRAADWADIFGEGGQADGTVPDLSGCLSLVWPGEMGLEKLLCAGSQTAPPPGDSDGPDAETASLPLGVLGGHIVEGLPPGPAMAGWLATTDPGSQDDIALAGLADAWRRLAAWAAAGELAAVAEMTARAAARDASVGVEPNGRPACVSEEATAEVGLALCRSRFSAAMWADLAVTLTWRLPRTLAALSSGVIDLSRARLLAEATNVLDEAGALAVEARVLAGAGRQTLGQLRAVLRRAVISVNPQAAERRREEAERRAGVSLYPDEEGTANLAGHNLPGGQAVAAMARITALAQAMKASGATGGIDLLRAKVFIGLLLNTLPFIPPPQEDPAAPGPPEPGPGSPAGAGPAGEPRTGAGPADGSPPGPDPAGEPPVRDENPPPPWPRLPVPGSASAAGCPAGKTGRVTLTIPWRTLAGTSSEPGAICWLGPVTPVAARQIAEAAADDPQTEWRVIVTGPAGEFICVARIRRPPCRPRAGLGHQGVAPVTGRGLRLINRVTLIVPVDLPEPGAAQPGSIIRAPVGSALAAKLAAALSTARKACAPMAEAAAGQPASPGSCSHADSEPGYRPSGRLRELVEARDQTCRAPGCRQPAWHSDLDHSIPYDKGGLTCSCNIGPRCRVHHKVKQRPGWHLDQPIPGVFVWMTPSGRRYTVTPDPYPT